MTVQLGWKSLLLAALVVCIAAVAVGWSIHRANKEASMFAQINARLVLKNERLAQEAAEVLDRAATVKAEAEAIGEELEEVEEDLQVAEEALEVAQRAAGRARRAAEAANRALGATEELPLVKRENTLLRGQNALLKKGLDLSKRETLQERTARQLTELALEKRTQQIDVWEERYSVLEKHAKKSRRRQALQGFAIGLGAAGAGFAGGYFAAKVNF